MKQYTLSEASIGEICQVAKAFYEGASVAHKEALRLSLMIEEALLTYQSRFGNDVRVELRTKEWLRRGASIQLVVFCPAYDPFSETDPYDILQSLSIYSGKYRPVWR